MGGWGVCAGGGAPAYLGRAPPRVCVRTAARPCAPTSVPPRSYFAGGRLRAGSAAGVLRCPARGLRGFGFCFFFFTSRAQKGRAGRWRGRTAEVPGLKGRKQLKLLLSD